MHAILIADAKMNLDRILKKVVDDCDPAIVINEAGQQVVIVPLDEYNSWQETRYLLRNPANAAHLRQSITEVCKGEFHVKELADAN